FERYHQLVPSDDKALLHLAESALNGESFPEAVKYYQEYLAKYPNNLQAKKNLAAAFFFVKKPVDSYNVFKTIPVDSLDAKSLVRYGQAANAVHDTTATIDAWSRAVKLDTTLSPIEYFLSNTLFAAKRYDEAIVHFRKHLAMTPDDAGAELNMGLCYIVLKDFPNSILAFKRVTELKPEYYLGYRWLALAYVYADSADQATDTYQAMIKLALADTLSDHSQELNEAYRSIAAYQLASGGKLQKAEKIDEAKKHYNEALSSLQTALKYDSKNARTHALLADAYALLGKTEDACKEIKTTLKLDPKNAEMLKLQKDLSCE
ncbi:MAG: tetratricopeptide repeat protein, partial [Candidatus Kryptoniota bacterium]